jgi:putative CocE/NonD family hydrolase
MTRRLLLLTIAAASLLAAPASASAAWKPGPEKYGVGEHANVPVTMSDGTVLKANVFYPTDPGGAAAKGPFPVIMVQTPYGKDAAGQASGGNGLGQASTEIGPLPYMIKRGYIDVAVDIRGTGDSHGTFNLLDPQIGRDGAELVDWAAKRPHSSGKVGTYGPSYMGIDQLMTAYNVGRHSPLKAIFPIVAGNDAYRDTAFQGGMPGIEFDLVILVLFGGLNVGNPPITDYGDLADLLQVEAEHVGSLLSYNAYQGLNILSGGDQAFYGKYWQARTPRKMLATIVRNHIPAFMVGGWFDLFQRGTPLNYSGLQNAWAGRPVSAPMKPHQRVTGRYQLVDGPWYHLDAGTGFHTYPLQLAWYDHFLKGKSTGITNTKTPLHLYELRSNHWHDASRYPLDQAKAKTYYLDAGPSGSGAPSTNDGTLTRKKPAAQSGADPVAYIGATSPCSRQTDQWGAGPVALALETGNLPPGPCETDDRTIQSGPGALTYTTAAVKRGTPLAGPIDATIYATSTRPDVELEATLEDVAPGGASYPLTSGALLGSFRKLNHSKTWRAPNGRPLIPYHPYTKASKTPVPTGEVTRFDIEVFPSFAELDKGHRLRLTLTTSDTPHLLPLPTDSANLDGGVYQVQRNAAHASFINVPMAHEGAFSPCSVCN